MGFLNEKIIYGLLYKKGVLKYLVRRKQIRTLLVLLNSITSGRVLRKLTSALTTAQKERLEGLIDPEKKTVALCFPPSAYGENLGMIGDKLRNKGYNVLILRGLSIGETYDNLPKDIFYVAGSVWEDFAELANIDLYICLGASEYFPKGGNIIMFVHDIHDSAVGKINHVLRTQSTFDYFFLPSKYVTDRVKQQIETGRALFQETMDRKEVCLIGGGYPKLDSNIRYFEKHEQDSKTIILATTVVEDLEGLVALPEFADKIIEAVLNAFTEYDLVFRPHPHTLHSAAVQKVAQKYANEPRFTLDSNPSFYMDNYSRAALMITDMSGTAYTYAFTTLRPVVFFSPDEPEVMKRFGTYQYFIDREKVGDVAQNTGEMVEKIKQLLAGKDKFTQKIREYRDSTIYNLGKSEDYFVDNIEYIIESKKHPDWIYI